MNRVMAGHSRSKNGVTSVADVPAMTIPIKFVPNVVCFTTC